MKNYYAQFVVQVDSSPSINNKKKKLSSSMKNYYVQSAVQVDSSPSIIKKKNKKRRKSPSSKYVVDYAKPVNFVTAGVVLPNHETDRHSNDLEIDDGVRSDLGRLGSSACSDIRVNAICGCDNIEDKNDVSVSGCSNDLLPNVSGSGKREWGGGIMMEREKNAFGGIGMKLLEKMGYKGGGLGKNQQGIVAPIQVTMRPKNMGMGYEEKAPVSVDHQNIVPSKKVKKRKKFLVAAKELEMLNPEEESAPSPQMFDIRPLHAVTKVADNSTEEKVPVLVNQQNIVPGKGKRWMKKQRAKKSLMAAKELEILNPEEDHAPSKLMVDMRQSPVRAVTNVGDNNREENAIDDDSPMSKLLRLTAQLAEFDTQKIDRYLRSERESVRVLQKQWDKLSPELAQQKKLLQKFEEIVSVMDLIIDENSRGTLTLDLLATSFCKIQRNHPDYYKFFESSFIAHAFALPSLSIVFQGWNPLQNPSHGLELISVWKEILQSQREYNLESEDLLSLYPQLILGVVVPALRISVISKWDASYPDPMIGFLEMWEKLIPPSVWQTILDEIVFPKIAAAVDRWDPREENVQIHCWIHPWLRLLSVKLETLYHIIQKKFGNILYVWHPRDGSAYAMLSPWKNVFDAESWENLMVCFIVPKLQDVMQEFLINPEDQKLDHFYWVISWASVVPTHYMVMWLQVFFLDKWKKIRDWLFSNLHFREIIQWYNGWKKLLPPELISCDQIQKQLDFVCNKMNQSVLCPTMVQPCSPENCSVLEMQERRQFEEAQPLKLNN
ncbi:hypothetical protein QQ045_028492 [Rhodiola kirilowii]